MAIKFPSIPEPGNNPQTQLNTLRTIKQVVELLAANATGDQNVAGPGQGAQIFALQEDVKKLLKQQTATLQQQITDNKDATDQAVDEAVSDLNKDISDAKDQADQARADALQKFDEISKITDAANAQLVDAFKKLETVTTEIYKIEDTGPNGIISARIKEEAGARATSEEAIAGRITKAAAFVGLNEATWQVGQVSLATKFSALSGAWDTYSAKYNDTYFASVDNKITAITSATGAIATATSNLETKLMDPVNGTVIAKLTTESALRSTADDALSGRITKAAAYLGLNEATWKVGDISVATRFSAMASGYKDYVAKTGDDVMASYTGHIVTTTTFTNAVATQLNTLETKLTVPGTAGRDPLLLSSAIISESNATTDAAKKIATAQNVQTTVASLSDVAGVNGKTSNGAITAAVKVESDARVSALSNIKATAAYSVVVSTTGASPAVTGFRAVSDSTNSTPISDFTIYANSFKVTNGITSKQVFSVDTVNSKINMTADVAIDGSLFVTGSINANPIAANAISNNWSIVAVNNPSASILNISLTAGDRITIIGSGGGFANAGQGSTGYVTVYYRSPTVTSGEITPKQYSNAFCDYVNVYWTGSLVANNSIYKFPPSTLIRTFTVLTTGSHDFTVYNSLGGDTGILVLRLSR